MKGTKDYDYEVIKHIGNIAENKNYTKEVNIISWSGREPVYDIRNFKVEENGTKCALKGITMSKEDLIVLRDALIRENFGV